MDRGPIFLAGIERSGTSLMYALLASHPQIAMTRRTNFWRFFYGQYGDLREQTNFESCLAAMLRYKRHLKLQPDAERIRREFWQDEPTYARLFALLQEHHAERFGKTRWGDKSLNTEHYVDTIFAVYPNARMIQMIRDPRDRYASAVTRWKKSRGRVGSGTARWRRSVELAQRNVQRYPDRYLIVRYESLVAEPERMLRQICAFIDEPYTPAMLTMEGAPAHRDRGGNSSYGKHDRGQISTASIGRFRKVLSPRDVAFMQAYAGRAMRAYGYDLEPLNLSFVDRLRFASIDWPANMARAAAWHLLEVFRNRIGRSPSSHTLIPARGLTRA